MDDLGEIQLLTALRHPQRRDILRRMHGRDAISPKELSEAMGAPLSNVGYHVRTLADCEAIELVRTKPVRGTLQHFYHFDIETEWALAMLGLHTA